MSKLRDDEAKKKKLQEENDVILTIGQEGKEGVKAFKEYAKVREELDAEKKSRREDFLENHQRNKFEYNSFLAGILLAEIKSIDWPRGWTYQIAPTKIGVVFELSSPDKHLYRTAFRSTGDGVLDLNAVKTCALRAENTLDRKLQSNGIYVPK